LIIFLSIVSFAQTNEELAKYMQIKVFVNTIEDVEKLYGKGKSWANKYSVVYKTPEMAIDVNYVTGNCQSKFSRWNLPEWTVEEITYTPQNQSLKLDDLIRDKKQYKVKQVGDVINHFEYYNEETGVSITYDDYLDEVIDISLRPSVADEKKYRCSLKN
jgi:hypothetical protein